jgi:hypothetical protein
MAVSYQNNGIDLSSTFHTKKYFQEGGAMSNNNSDLYEFIDSWTSNPNRMKEAFVVLKNVLKELEGVELDYQPRPGLTYSLRGTHPNQSKKPLFVMVDVIESEPRWLSVCFYNDMVTDPDECGDFVPGGLLGEDALCIDFEEYDEGRIKYITARITEAYSCIS